MPCDVKLNENLQIVELVYTDFVTSEILRKSTADGMALVSDSGLNRVLIDASLLESVQSMADVYDLPRTYDDGGLSRKIRFALVLPKANEARNVTRFYDDVCNNRGWRVQPFDTRDEAIEWLTSNESS